MRADQDGKVHRWPLRCAQLTGAGDRAADGLIRFVVAVNSILRTVTREVAGMANHHGLREVETAAGEPQAEHVTGDPDRRGRVRTRSTCRMWW